jgi:hypothetical protein
MKAFVKKEYNVCVILIEKKIILRGRVKFPTGGKEEVFF